MAEQALRVLAFAQRSCKRAGIRIIVITGDYGITAGAIAQELGIIDTIADNIYI